MKLGGVMIGTADSVKLSEFYTKILGEPGMNDSENGWFGYSTEGETYIVIGPHSEVHGKSENPARLIINFTTTDVAGEFERIVAAGGVIVAQPYQPDAESMPDAWLATVADPDGNYIQIGTPWK
jgi:predicted enzyme related to lactoylglutathione lyase